MSTAANVKTSESGHWYHQDGTPAYTVIAKGTGQPRPTTLRDARQLNLLPSVTTILRVLDAPALTAWKVEQAVLAVMTTPRQPGETDDVFIQRVLHADRVQDEEAQKARNRGTAIHDALEAYFTGQDIDGEILPWIVPAAKAVEKYGNLVACEKILVGDGYAGRTDLIQLAKDCVWIWDWKSAKKLPDPTKGGAWSEHRLQAAAYAKAFLGNMPVRTANCYISTVECGKFVICEHDDWQPTYDQGFAPLVKHWCWSNNYTQCD